MRPNYEWNCSVIRAICAKQLLVDGIQKHENKTYSEYDEIALFTNTLLKKIDTHVN